MSILIVSQFSILNPLKSQNINFARILDTIKSTILLPTENVLVVDTLMQDSDYYDFAKSHKLKLSFGFDFKIPSNLPNLISYPQMDTIYYYNTLSAYSDTFPQGLSKNRFF